MCKGAFNVKTKLLSWLLTLSLLMTMLPTAALAAADPGTSSDTVIYVSESGDDSAAGDESAPLKTIGAAFTKAADGGTIYLLSDIVLPSKTVLSGDKSITLAGNAGEAAPTIKYSWDGVTTNNLYMIEIGAESGTSTQTNITLRNLTVDAEAQDIRCLRVCPGSQLILADGATVRNGRAINQDGTTGTSDCGGGIVVDNDAKLTMEDGSSITGCSAEWGGAVYLSGEMAINGGEISNNTAVGDIYEINDVDRSASAHGGAIMIRACRADYATSYDAPAKLTMRGGTISGNAATSDVSAFGGAISIIGTPDTGNLTNTFVMSGGTISNNKAVYGGAVSAYAADNYWHGNISIQLSGNAQIKDNIARTYGGAICLFGNNAQNYTYTLTMSGGMISGNKANSAGGGVYLSAHGDQMFMTGGSIRENEAGYGGGLSIRSGNSGANPNAAVYLLGGTISDNQATSGYPTDDSYSERLYCGNAIEQSGELYLDGTQMNVSGDIRVGCTTNFRTGAIETNRYVTLVGASDSMQNYELTSDDDESLDGRVVVAPGTITYGTETYSVADAEPYLSHFTHNYKEIVTNTEYEAETGTSSQPKSLVLHGFSVTYTDGIGGTSFADEVTSDLRRGTPTPAFTGGTPTRSGYTFTGWEPSVAATVTDNAVYTAQWKLDEAYAVKIAPMNLTVYVGGDGYHGVIGEDGKFAANDLPEIGFYITLPDDINTMLGGTDEKPVDLSDKLRLTPVDDNGTMRSWSLELYSDESKSHVMETGRRVYVYKLRQIDDGEETVPRVQFTGADGSVMTESKFQALLTDQFRNYKISVYQGLLDEQIYKATFTTADGKTFTRPIKLGTGTLKVRGNNDTTYRAIENNTIPSVNPQEKDIMLVSTAQTDTQYYINNSGISVPSSDDVKLMVDHSLDDALLSAYINRTSNTEGKYSYQFRYLDLVDTSNGNTYVTMGAGQKMNLYWPVPSDAKSNSEFHIIHFKGIDRDSDADVNELLTTRIPEELTCETVTIGGQKFVTFAVDSFSPFALLYEKAASSGGGYSSGGGSNSSKYTLHYESNGGTSYKDESYSSGTTVTLDKAPVRESYTFTGWYADKALTQKITSVTMNGDKTVYAGWEATGVPDKLNGDDHFAYVIGYPDGKVHPEGNISRAETATIFFRLLKADIRDGNLTADNDFSDVSDGQWHNKAVSTMAKLGIVKGRRADSFDPNASITRAEFAAICARFNTKPVENSGSFSDISGHWAENEIERAAAFGWISGYPDGTFRPDARITRAEAMTMINRVLCRMPQSKSDLLNSMVTWSDNKPSDWHYLAVQEATNSHDFDRQGEVGESWTKLTSVPDWTRYQ